MDTIEENEPPPENVKAPPEKVKAQKSVSFGRLNIGKIRKNASFTRGVSFRGKKPGCGLIQFLTLRIIFVDLLVRLGDLGSDLAQGRYLFFHESGKIF